MSNDHMIFFVDYFYYIVKAFSIAKKYDIDQKLERKLKIII